MKTITYDETKWKLVPAEPTEEMLNQPPFSKGEMLSDPMNTDDLRDIYLDMLAAAPEAPSQNTADAKDAALEIAREALKDANRWVPDDFVACGISQAIKAIDDAMTKGGE